MKAKVILITILCIQMMSTALAQGNEKRFGFELSGGASLATSKPGDAKLNPGLGFEGIFHYCFMPHTGVYAGWGWNHFGSDDSFAGKNIDFEETGYVFGLQYKHPFGQKPLAYYFRAGGLYNHIELENTDGDIIADSGHGLGFQLATGIDYSLGKNWSITPGLKFNYLNREITTDELTTKLDHQYLSLRVGILKKF